jgi:hypothetical protein
MTFWGRVVAALRAIKGIPYPGNKPSEKMRDEADMILSFAASSHWDGFQKYVEGRLGMAMDGIFGALQRNDEKAVIRESIKAKVYYDFLRDVDRALAVAKKMSEVKIKP